MDSFIAFLFVMILGAIVLLILDRLNLGLSVGGFTNAVVAALVIAAVSILVSWTLGVLGISIGGGLLGAIVTLVVAALVILLAGRLTPGFTVNGFGGAVIAGAAALYVVFF